jgi:hypothetical protein
MPIDSTVRRGSPVRDLAGGTTCRWVLCVAVFAFLGLQTIGCAKPQAIVTGDLLDPLSLPTPWLPTPADLAAARLARAALVSEAPDGLASESGVRDLDPDTPAVADPRVESALAKFDSLEFTEDQKDLYALAIDLRNASLDDPVAYRAGARKLRKKRGLDPRLRARLDRTIGDDPLKLAGRRQFDGWHRLWARSFNAVAQPIGQSAITGFVLAPYSLANSLIHWAAEFTNSEPLSFSDRQALVLRQEFLARYPNTSATPKLKKKIERDEVLLEKTLVIRRLRASESALKAGAPELAFHHARASLNMLWAHPKANASLRKKSLALMGKAERSISARSQLAALSREAIPTRPKLREAEYRLSESLLWGPMQTKGFASRMRTYRKAAGSKSHGRVEYIRALVQNEDGFEAAARKRLGRIAAKPATRDTMGRYAHAMLQDDWQNPYGAFQRYKRQGLRDELGWRLAGEWVNRPRYPNMPTPIAYLVDTPTIIITILLAPLRAIISPWTGSPDFQRATALTGYRYLIRFPDGEEQRPIIDWLYDYEMGQERWDRALRMADWMPEFDAAERNALIEKSADNQLAQAQSLGRRDTRSSILRGLAREFPDSNGGFLAGLQAREEWENASPQHIRITKGFLLENPAVAGRNGAGIAPRLLNDDPADGELHPEGIVLRGGRVLEILLIAEGADDDSPPERSARKISKERLKRIASTLEEAVQLNGLIDAESRQAADANRDVYLERAAHGLTEEPDVRASAESSYVYRSLRERYGMVRGRDSILPFDIVFRGSLGDFSLGAFPRWRNPRETQDAFLYR